MSGSLKLSTTLFAFTGVTAKENKMTKLTYTKISPTFHVYPDRNEKELIQITCADLDACLDTVRGQRFYPAVIKDPNNQKEYYMDEDRNTKEI